MWRFTCAATRERNTASISRRILRNNVVSTNSAFRSTQQTQTQRRHLSDKVSVQLDYYLSPQFAGVASALAKGGYASRGIDISFLPICPVGLEQARVREHYDANASAAKTVVGTVEQNIFIPTLAANPALRTTAVAAMFGESPLCVASVKDPSSSDGSELSIGTHEDTVELMQRIFPERRIVASPRATKISDLTDGTYSGIQAYDTTEVPALRRLLGKEPFVTPMEGCNGARLGYSQVIFAADECLQDDRKSIVQAFLEATFEGWMDAVRDPEEAARMVAEAKKMLSLDDESNDHWYPSAEFDAEMLERCNGYVKKTFQGDRLGVIDAGRWSEASEWLLSSKDGKSAGVPANFGLDPTVWQPSANLLGGNQLARRMLEDAKASASSFKDTYGRRPSLAVVTVGKLNRYEHGDRRLELYSNPNRSWFSKTESGDANGFDVTEIDLDATTTTDALLSQIYALKDVDGIQLMWPLPPHIDAARVYSAIDTSKDVDGIHYIGQCELGNTNAYPPVTPAAAVALMDEYGVEVKNKRVVVVGRSRIVGSPLAHMLRERGGAVTVVHTGVEVENLKVLVGDADVVVCCAGAPGSIKSEWIGKDTTVINVGTTFDVEKDALVSDVEGDISDASVRYSPVPGGIGPMSAPALFQNVAKAAWDRMSSAAGGVAAA